MPESRSLKHASCHVDFLRTRGVTRPDVVRESFRCQRIGRPYARSARRSPVCLSFRQCTQLLPLDRLLLSLASHHRGKTADRVRWDRRFRLSFRNLGTSAPDKLSGKGLVSRVLSGYVQYSFGQFVRTLCPNLSGLPRQLQLVLLQPLQLRPVFLI